MKEKRDSTSSKYMFADDISNPAKISRFDININSFDKWEIEYYVSGNGNGADVSIYGRNMKA